jgi:tetratricopeptide (TPR) repeat protein
MNKLLIKTICLKVAATLRLRFFYFRRLKRLCKNIIIFPPSTGGNKREGDRFCIINIFHPHLHPLPSRERIFAYSLKSAAIICALFIFSLLLAQDLNLAQRYEAAGQLALAKTIYQAYLTENPFNPSVYNSYYRVSFSLGNYQEFLTLSLELLKKNPKSPDLLISIGEAFLKLGKKKQSLDYLNQAFNLSPDYFGRISAMLSQEKMYKDAIRFVLDFQKLRKNPIGFEPMLIDLYEADGDYLKATREITKFLDANPPQLPGYEPRLRSYLAKTNPSAVLNELNNLTNKELRARLLSKLYLSQKRYSEAVAEIKTLNSPNELYSFARFCEEQEQYQIAADLYQKLGNHSDQARVLRKLGKVAEAAEVLQQESSIEARFELAELERLELHDNRAAKENYRLVIKRQPSEPAYYGLVASLINLGQLDEAKKALAKMGKTSDRSLFSLIQINFFQAQFESCQKYIQQLSHDFPASPLLNDALEIGILLAEGKENLPDYALASFNQVLGNYDDAINLAQKLIKQNDKIAEHSFILLAELYLAKKEPNLALSALQELKAKFPNSRLLPQAKFEQAKIYSEKLKDEVKYQQTLEELIVDFPSSPYSSIARNLLAKFQKPEPIH